MKTIIIFFLITITSLTSIQADLLKFDELASEIQQEIIIELGGVTPIIIKDLSPYTKIDGTYLGLFKSNQQLHTFELFIWYGTQGAFGVVVKDITVLPSF